MILLPALAAIGFLISAYLLYAQKAHLRLICFIGKNCEVVVSSRYSKTFGIENTVFGLAYYSAIFAVTFFGIDIPLALLLLAASAAALFSIYLSALQLFVIKGFCDYCLVANAANLMILTLLLSNPL